MSPYHQTRAPLVGTARKRIRPRSPFSGVRSMMQACLYSNLGERATADCRNAIRIGNVHHLRIAISVFDEQPGLSSGHPFGPNQGKRPWSLWPERRNFSIRLPTGARFAISAFARSSLASQGVSVRHSGEDTGKPAGRCGRPTCLRACRKPGNDQPYRRWCVNGSESGHWTR